MKVYFCDNNQCPQHIKIIDREILERGLETITKTGDKHFMRHLYQYRDGGDIKSMWFCDVCVNAIKMCKEKTNEDKKL